MSTNTISTTDARSHFSTLLNKVSFGHKRFRLFRQGKPLAALVSIEDLDYLEALEDKMDILEANLSEKEITKKGTKSLKALLKELGLEGNF